VGQPEALDDWEGRPVEEWARLWDVPLLEAYDELPSTNDHLRVLAEAGAAHFTVVIADAQTAGRFRREVSPTFAAKVLYGALDEMATNWILSRRRYALATQADEVVDLFVNGMTT